MLNMFRSVSTDEHFTKGKRRPLAPAGVESLSQDRQDRSWISLLSVVSRPAFAFFQKYLPGRFSTSTISGKTSGGVSVDFNQGLDGECQFLGQQDDIIPGNVNQRLYHVTYLHYKQNRAGFSPSSNSLSWLTANSFSQLGIHGVADINVTMRNQKHVGYLAMARKVFSQVLLYAFSSQEVKHAKTGLDLSRGAFDMVASPAKTQWWDGLWKADGGLSNVSWNRVGITANVCHCGDRESGRHCHEAECSTSTQVAKSTELLVQSEPAGIPCHIKETHNGLPSFRPESLLSTGIPSLEHPRNGYAQPIHNRVFATCSEAAALTPDQDNGYSSLEEEHSIFSLQEMKPICPEEECEVEDSHFTQGCPELYGSLKGDSRQSFQLDKSSASQKEEEKGCHHQEDTTPSIMTNSQCQNKAILYIMGEPCSESSQSEDENWSDSDDDDGFDSEGSSVLSESEDPEEVAERLLRSLCQNSDPYNPLNFKALIHSAQPSTTTASPAPKAPALEGESWDEASDVDEVETQRLWSTFSSGGDPFSPLHFQAPLRTGVGSSATAGSRKRMSPGSGTQEQLDGGFSEAPPTHSCVKLKKVRFVEEVEEFYTSEDEDRRGLWEELARDRCRFLRRVQDTEEIIGYILNPCFRQAAYQRLRESY